MNVMKILLIEDNPRDAELIRDMLDQEMDVHAEFVHVKYLNQGFRILLEQKFDVILLDLLLPDSGGQKTVNKMKAVFESTPVVILSGLMDRDMAVDAVRSGAQDFLVKGEFQGPALLRTIQHACVRHRKEREQMENAMFDELTGLYTRRSFMKLASNHRNIAERNRFGMALFFLDLEGLKAINDSLGHGTGDSAIRSAADFVRMTFRDSDLLARLGGDKFVGLAMNVQPDDILVIRKRLSANIKRFNMAGNHSFNLSLSVGAAHISHTCPKTMDALLHSVDQKMYLEKRAKSPMVSREGSALAFAG